MLRVPASLEDLGHLLRAAPHLEEDESCLGVLGGHRYENGVLPRGHEDDVAVGALDVDLGQIALVESLRGPLTQTEECGAHRGKTILLDVGGQRRSHREAVGADDRGRLHVE